MFSQLSPRVSGSAVLVFLVLFSTSSLAYSAVIPLHAIGAAKFLPSVVLLENHPPSRSFEPLRNTNEWNDNIRKKKPVEVPEGGSVAAYLTLTGLASLVAIGLNRHKSQIQAS
jgi:hypothetical protein